MEGCDSIDEDFKTLPTVKIEIFDGDTEQSVVTEQTFGCFEEIELGHEFKTEPVIVKKPVKTRYNITNLEFKQMYCSKCDKTWKYDSKKGHICHLCSTSFTYKCRKCKKHFNKRYSLTAHLSFVCNAELKFICDHCQFKTKTKTDLASHIYAKHLPRDPNKNKCKKCGKSYSWKSDLARHTKLCGKTKYYKHLPALKSFYCHDCGYQTRRKDHLTLHIKSQHLLPRNFDRSEKNLRSKNNGKSSKKLFSRQRNSNNRKMIVE